MLICSICRWWFTIESTTTKHLISQFKKTIQTAIASKTKVRAEMRARAALQRFPVAQWVEDLSVMQDTAIKISQKQAFKPRPRNSLFSSSASGVTSPRRFWSGQSSLPNTGPSSALPSALPSGQSTRAPSPSGEDSTRRGPLSLGLRVGPGHAPPKRESRLRKRLTRSNPALRNSSAGPSSAPGSRTASPARRFRRKSKSQVRDSAMDTTSEDVPAMPPLPEQLNGLLPSIPPLPEQFRGGNASRITESAGQDDIEGSTTSQGDMRRMKFRNGSFIDEHGQSGSASADERTDLEDDAIEAVVDEYILSPEEQEASKRQRRAAALRMSLSSNERDSAGSGPSHSALGRSVSSESLASTPGTPMAYGRLVTSGSGSTPGLQDSITPPTAAFLSLGTVLQGKKDYKLQSVEPFFTDPTGLYYNAFEKKLAKLNGKSSEGSLCVEEYLTASEKDWFNRFRNVKMGKSPESTPASSVFRLPLTRQNSTGSVTTADETGDAEYNRGEQYLLQDDYQPPTGIKKVLLTRIGQWPLYSFLLAFVSVSLVDGTRI